ncbi:MAG: SMC-Scp complex subunit ScpB [Candidatus Diapherotrites archaeon]
MPETAEIKKVIEAALFMSSKPLSLTDLYSISKANVSDLRIALNELTDEFKARDSALEISENSLGFQMKLRSGYENIAASFASKSELNRSESKTLAFIAYKQPIKQSVLVKYRGNQAYEDVKLLEEKGLIARAPEGRSYIVRTTKKFLDYFGEKPVTLKPREEKV